MSIESLAGSFNRYFRIIFADTPELRNQVYRIRYEVYCREFQYEREEDCLRGLEKDIYDRHSLHCLVIHRASNIPAGCIRIVKVPNDNPLSLLPFEKFCGSSLYPESLHPRRFSRSNFCEISRLAIPATFRRRKGESKSPFGNIDAVDFTGHERRTFPSLSIALFLAATALGALAELHHGFAMMEPRLVRLLQRSGLEFTQIGKLIEYHGLRAAFHTTLSQALDGMKPELRELYDFIYQGIEGDFARANSKHVLTQLVTSHLDQPTSCPSSQRD